MLSGAVVAAGVAAVAAGVAFEAVAAHLAVVEACRGAVRGRV